jgi:hypothetical protein
VSAHRTNRVSHCCIIIAVVLGALLSGAARGSPIPAPVRIESGVSGHIHPALCLTKHGTLVAVYCQSEFKPYLITRSVDRGRTWSKPKLFPHTAGSDIYPGSLTTLADGRIMHAWNVWYQVDERRRSRYVAYAVSDDDGLTWGEPMTLRRSADPRVHSVVRHPIVELSSGQWLLALIDRTTTYDPAAESESAFGDQRNHGQVPIVRTVRGTWVSGRGLRSVDGGASWHQSRSMPDLHSDGWRFEMIALKNGLILASRIVGPGFGDEKIEYVASADDGVSWDVDRPIEFYNPGRPIGGRACPRTVEIDAQTLGTIFYDTDANQPGGSGIFFRTWPTPQPKR